MKPPLLLSFAAMLVTLGHAQTESAPSTRWQPRISGTVVDASTREPIPAFEIGVVFSREDFFPPEYSRQKFSPPHFTKGQFEYVGAPVGKYWLIAKAPGYAGGWSEELVVSPGARFTRIEIRVIRGTRVGGRVSDGKGAPIADAQLSLEPPSERTRDAFGGLEPSACDRRRFDCPTTATKRDGSFEFLNVLPVKCMLKVRHPAFVSHESAPFDVWIDADRKHPDVVLTAGATIRGRVRLAGGGFDAKAAVFFLSRNEVRVPGDQGSANTNADGRFEVLGLPPGRYRLTVIQREGRVDLHALFRGDRDLDGIVRLAEGEVKEIDL